MSRVVFLAMATALAVVPLAAQSRPPKPDAPEAVLAAYLAGDIEAIGRSFKTSVDFQTRFKLGEPKEFDKWLGEFDPGKAVFVLSLSQSAAVTARQYAPVLLRAGGRYVDGTSGRVARPGATAEFARAWHRAAVGLLQGLRHEAALEEYLGAIDARGRREVASDGRLLLAKGISQELHCWATRPALEQPSLRVDALAKQAGVVVKEDLDGPTRAQREAMATRYDVCLSEALARFDAARAHEESRAEAGVRGGWVLVQQGRFQDAFAWLGAASAGSDRVLAYWRSLFLGRALSGLNRHREAADAYRDAFTRYPGSQSAGLGLAFELTCLDEDAEADRIARSLRATAIDAVDPWTTYLDGDGRFAGREIEQLRRSIIQ